MAEPKSIVITGTPGSGKTTVSKIVASRNSFRLIELNSLAKESHGIEGMDTERGALVINARRLRTELRKIMKNSNETFLIEGHFGELVPKEYVRTAIVLRLNPTILIERLRKRGYAEAKVRENVEAELLDSCLINAVEAFGEHRVLEIDATGQSEESLAKKVEDAIRKGEGMPPGSVDWTARLQKEGKLESLLL